MRTAVVAGTTLALALAILGVGSAPTVQAQGVVSANYQHRVGGGAELTVNVRLGIVRWNEVFVEVEPGDALADFRVLTLRWRADRIFTDDAGRRMLAVRRDLITSDQQTVVIVGPGGRGRDGHITVARDGLKQITVSNRATFRTLEPTGPPSPSPPPSSLARFDRNGNDRLDDAEFLEIIDAWIDNELGDATFFRAMDLWISGRPISSVASGALEPNRGSFRLSRHASTGALTVTATVPRIQGVRLNVFDLAGRRVGAERADGARLTWHPPATVPNGVYLAQVRAISRDGLRIAEPLQMFIVRR